MKRSMTTVITAVMVAAILPLATFCSDEDSPTKPPGNGTDPTRSWVMQTGLPSVYDLYGVYATPTLTVAVGAGGVILRYNGERWVRHIVKPDHDLYDIQGNLSGDIWIVGDGGTALRYRHDTQWWVDESMTNDESLRGVWPVAPDAVFVAALDGRVYKFDGSDWTAISPGPAGFHDIFAMYSSSCLAVGEDNSIYDWDGTSWGVSRDMNEPDVTLRCVWGTDYGNAYVVGDNGYWAKYIVGRLERIDTQTADTLYSVTGTGRSDPTAVGTNGTILSYGTSGLRVQDSGTGHDLYAVSAWLDAVDAEHRVAVGDNVILSSSSDWRHITRGTMHPFNDVWGRAADDVYVAGMEGTVLHFDGAGWEIVTTGVMPHLWRIWGDASSVSVADQQGQVHRYDGADWRRIGGFDRPDVSAPIDVCQIPGGHLVAVTNGHALVMAGDQWARLGPIPVPNTYFEAIWGSSNSVVIAVARRGGIYRWDGTDWSLMTSQTLENLVSVWGSNRYQVFAAGDNGTLLTWDGIGSTWSKLNTRVIHDLRRVWGTSGTNVFAVGNVGTVLKFNGFGFETMSIETVEPLFGVWQDDAGTVTTVGGNDIMDGLIFRYQTGD